MIELNSKTLRSYYGNSSDEYYIKFIHHNIDIEEDSPIEYEKLDEDLNNIYNFDKDAFLLYFSDIDNYCRFTNNLEIKYPDKTYLRIRTKDDYKKLKDLNINKSINIIIDINDIEKLNISDYNLTIQTNNVSDLSLTKLDYLLEKYNIKEVSVGQIPYITKDNDYLYDVMSSMYGLDSNMKLELEKINKLTNDIYSIKDYFNMLNKFNNIIDSLDIKNSYDGIYKIFNYVAISVSYDNDGVENTKIEDQNLIGPVLHGVGVCEGYSKMFKQLLSLIGVESIIVQGGDSKESGGHVWNQVFIDGTWYNIDVTVASNRIKEGKEVNTFLVKDSVLLYKTDTAISHECNVNYGEDIVVKSK